MKKLIITVSGKQDSGKTHTIKKLISLLGLEPLVTSYTRKRTVEWTVITDYNGVKIGLCSLGDPNHQYAQDWFDKAVKAHCDIIVIASRTSGSTVTNLCNVNYAVLQVKKFSIHNPCDFACIGNLEDDIHEYQDCLNAAEIAKLINLYIANSKVCLSLSGKDNGCEKIENAECNINNKIQKKC